MTLLIGGEQVGQQEAALVAVDPAQADQIRIVG